MKKIFFVTIPMLPTESLKSVKYKRNSDGHFLSYPSSFPSIPMIEWNACNNDDIKIVAIMTDDETGRSKVNFEKYKTELSDLQKKMGIRDLKISETLFVAHQETKEKQVKLFRDISGRFEEEAEIYMDITYGTKITSIGLFASLVYAEKISHCHVKSIVYGKYSHDDSSIGEIYDLKSLYELNMMINSATFLNKEQAEKLLDALWG